MTDGVDEMPNVIRPTDEAAISLAKSLLRTARSGALATLDPASGDPQVSRVGVATDIDGAPLLLVSMLAPHTRAMIENPRVSLLLGDVGKGDPLAHPRMTISANAEALERGSDDHERAQRRYLNHNPKASLYAGLGDFKLMRLSVHSASLNGGFGKAFRLTADELTPRLDANAELSAGEQSAVDHMNADHAEAVDLYAQHYTGATSKGWRLTGLDAEGMILAKGDAVVRIGFVHPLGDASALRLVLIDMARSARTASSGGSEKVPTLG